MPDLCQHTSKPQRRVGDNGAMVIRPLMRYRLALLISVVLLVPLGFWVRFYQGGQAYWNDLLGAIAYEMFWILWLLLVYPTLAIWQVAIGVFLGTSFFEFLQLWHPPLLEAMRATFIGRLLLGTTFNWADFLSYAIGCLAGGLWATPLHRATVNRRC